MSSNFSRVILVSLVVVMLITGVALSWIPAQADDPDMSVIINAAGNHIDLQVNVTATSANLWINGIPWEALISSGISQAMALSAPNSQWSGGDATGWDGYYGVTSNDMSVTVKFDDGRPSKTFVIYRGAGCGMWGVNDGSVDSWARRQILALAVRDAIREYQIEYLQKDQAAKARIIASLSDNMTKMEGDISTLNLQVALQAADLQKVQKDYALAADLQNLDTTVTQAIWVISLIGGIPIILSIIVTALWISRRRTY